MNGYDCPCCGGFIPLSGKVRARECPTCKASIYTQRVVRERKTGDRP